jgi:hypothetical protein
MKSVLLIGLLFLSGCGYSARDNQLTGQVKGIIHQTPIFCNERFDGDISLGVMRNGVGSMSTADVAVTVKNEADVELLRRASESGALVKVTYDVKRWTWCWQDHIVTKAELVK